MKCELCGMRYVIEIPDDVRDHQEYHDKVIKTATEKGNVITKKMQIE